MSEHRKQFLSGVAYTAMAKYAGMFIQLGITTILSRLLTPAEFGVVAVATVLITFFTTFSDMGLGTAIIQHKDLSGRDLDDLYSFTCWTGLALALLFFGGAEAIARFYDSPVLEPICRVLSLQLLMASANIAPNALIYRDKRFKFLGVRTVVIQIAAGAVAVALALALPARYKIYALTAQPVLSQIAVIAVNLREYPLRLRFSMGGPALRRVFGYSAWQFMFNFINYFSRNLDKLVIGKWLNMAQLGYYEKSYRLMLLPLQNITSVLAPVIHPVFSEMQHDRRAMLDNYMKVVRWLSLVGFPVSVALLYNARELMLIIFGWQWEASVPPFRILSLIVGVQVVLSSSGPIFQAAGDTRSLFVTGLVSALVNIGCLVGTLIAFGTIEAVAWGMAASYTLSFFLTYIYMLRATFREGMGAFWRAIAPGIALSLLLLAVMWPLYAALGEWSLVPALMLKGTLAAVMWAAWVQLTGEFDIIGKVKTAIRR